MARYTIADLEKQLALMTANRKADDMIVGSTIHEAARESAKRNKARAEALKLQKELQDKETKASPEHHQVRPEGGKKPPKRSEQKKHERPTQKAPGKPTEEPKDRETKTPEHRQVRPEQKRPEQPKKPEDGKKISTASLKEAAVKAAESGGRVVRRVVEGGKEAARNVYNKGRETDEKHNAPIPRGLRAVERHIDKGRAYPVRLDTSDLVIPEISSKDSDAAVKQYESVLKLWRKAIDKKTRDAARKHRLSMLR